MQIFLPFADFEEAARSLDTRRLGKQRVETQQILTALTRATPDPPDLPYVWPAPSGSGRPVVR